MPRLLLRFQIVLLLLAVAAPIAGASTPPPTRRYWLELRDKEGVSFNAATYFHPAAQARRQRQHLPPADFTDLPVRADYLQQVRAHADTVLFVSRWFNAVACQATAAQAAALAGLPGVRSMQELPTAALLPAARPQIVAGGKDNKTISAADQQLARLQTRTLGAGTFQRAGLDGRGLRIAIFDVGFSGADQHPAFKQLFAEKKVVASYDFVRKIPNVFHGGTHGLEVLSCLAGRLPDGTLLGLAPGAEYLLARTERIYREVYTEELDWLAAVEWADRNGADIINSSLGYTTRRYFPENMDGHTSLVARAAELAVRKGMLVVNAAGNDGDNDDWRTIGTPADADSVLAVGGVSPETGLHLDFSAYGPSADRRLKPNVSAFGTVLAAAPGGGYARIDGTSFASPLVAGFAACAWQQQRTLPVMALFAAIQKAGTLYPYYDYAHGYGMPQADAVLQPTARPRPAPAPTVNFISSDSVISVVIRPEAAQPVVVRALPLYLDSVGTAADLATAPERVASLGREEARPPTASEGGGTGVPPASAGTPPLSAAGYFFWHVADAQGVLHRYEVMEVGQRAILRIPRRSLHPGDVVRVFYLGATHSYPIL